MGTLVAAGSLAEPLNAAGVRMIDAGEQGDDDVELVIKRSSAANLKDVRLVMPLGSTLAELKARLQGLYEDRPEPACVAVIHAGHVLKDDSRKLRDILNVAMGSPHSLHVVVRDRPTPSAGGAPPQQQLRAPAVQSPAPAPAPSAPASTSTQAHTAAHTPALGTSAAPVAAYGFTRLPASAPLVMPPGSAAAPAPGGPAALGLSPAPSLPAARRMPDGSQPQPALPTPPSRPTSSDAGLGSGRTDGLPPPQIPPNLAGNPAMAAAFRAAFEALTSPTAIHNLTVPQPQGTQLPQPMHLGGSLLLQQHPLPHLQPFFPQPITYMPALGLVQPPPGPDGQQAQPRYTTVLAPVMPMMMPYGMMPYAPPAAVQFPLQQPEPMQYTAQAPPVPPAQANNPINNIFAGFPGLGFPGLRPAGGAAAAAAGGAAGAANAGGRARNGRQPQVRVRLIQINLRALLQLAVMGVILYQHCPPGRFLLFASVGLALYVMGPAPLRRAWHRLLAMLPPMHGPGHAAGPAQDAFNPGGAAGIPVQQGDRHAPGQNGGMPAGNVGVGAGGGVRVNPPGQPPVRGFVQEVQALVVGFFTSLLPGWNINPEDAAAFAAAQQAANANEARAAAGLGDNREHFE